MKKEKKFAAIAAACVVLALGAWACSNYAGRDVKNVDALKPVSTDIFFGTLRFPAGTTFENLGNGQIMADLPDEYAIVGYNASGAADKIESTDAQGNKISISCSCSNDRGCTPYKAKNPAGEDQVGCSTSASNPCPSCTMNITKLNGEVFKDPKFINLSLGIEFVFSQSASQGLEMCPFESNVLILPEVVEQLNYLRNYVYAGESVPTYSLMGDTSTVLPPGYKLITINFFGYKAYYPATPDFIGEATFGVLSPSSPMAEATCSCTQGSGCKKVGKILGATYCRDVDKCSGTCTLSI